VRRLLVTASDVPSSLVLVTLMMETVHRFLQEPQRHMTEDDILQAAGYLPGLLFEHEAEGIRLLCNFTKLLPDYTVPNPRNSVSLAVLACFLFRTVLKVKCEL
jgi:hypothetical protein